MFTNLKLRTKLLLAGCFLTFIPLVVMSGIVYNQNQGMVRLAEKESLRLAQEDFQHIIDSIYTLAESHQEVTDRNITSALKVAGEVLENMGGISFSDETVEWEMVNQYTKKTHSKSLPGMNAGNDWLGRTFASEKAVPVVDKVSDLLGVTCTIFQRVNEKGDMLRVATSVIKKNGKRAIGTYIPATNPDGAPNPVIAAVLSGKTFRGRAYVVNAWYITAYEPIRDAGGRIVGVLYAGIPQENVSSLRKAIMNVKVGKTGYAYVIDSTGSYAISQGGKRDGENILSLTDSAGLSFISEIVNKAAKLKGSEAGEQSYMWKDSSGRERLKTVKFVHFKPWDWIITAGTFEDELHETAERIDAVGDRVNLVLMGVLILSMLVTAVTWLYASSRIIRPINDTVERLKDIAQGEGDLTMRLNIKNRDEVGELAHWFNLFVEKLRAMLKEIGGTGETVSVSSTGLKALNERITENVNQTSTGAASVARASEEMNRNMESVTASTEEASTNVSMVAAASEEMNATINEIAQNTEMARTTTDKTVRLSRDLSKGMESLGKAASEINQVTTAITEISEQTNLLALNATIEAARAGDAGKGFAVVANEIKDLARQTAEATLEIRGNIQGVQDAVTTAGEQISEIDNVVGDVNNIVTTIATAVEEQSIATKEIAANAGQAASGIEQVTRNITDTSSIISDITGEVGGVSRSVDEILGRIIEANINSDEMNSLSLHLDTLTGQFKTGEKRFNIGQVKVAHLAWRSILEAVIQGRRQMTPEEVTSHRECEFGKWYFGPGQSMASEALFKEVGTYHEQVHAIAREIVSVYNSGNKEKAEKMLDDFKRVRLLLFEKLDALYLL